MNILLHGRQQQRYRPNLAKSMQFFFKQFKQYIQQYEVIPGYLPISILQFSNQSSRDLNQFNKMVVVWKHNDDAQQIWWQYCYNKKNKFLSMTSFVTINHLIMRVQGLYNINLTMRLFQRYNNQLNKQRQFLQFNINPATGTINIFHRSLCQVQLFITQIMKPKYKRQILNEMRQMIAMSQEIIQLFKYFRGDILCFPSKSFLTKNNEKKSNKTSLTPQVFLNVINLFNKIDPKNEDEDLQNFGSSQSIKQFVNKNQIQFPQDVMKIVQILKGQINEEDYNFPLSICEIFGQIYDASYADDPQSYQNEKIARKIKILSENVEWQIFAHGGFGKLQKANVKYELTQLNGKNKEICIGQLVRKSDIQANKKKIQHQHKIFSLFKSLQHDNIMPHYIPEQQIYKNYIFSKYQPNMSLQKYIKKNSKTLGLQTILRFLEHTLKGLLILKQQKIVHLDIKPNNIIISKNLQAKISDFGQAFYLKWDPKLHKPGFTIPYIPLEFFREQPFYSSKIDVYSFGVTMFKVIFGYHIWGQIFNQQKFMDSLQQGKNQIKLTPQKIKKYGFPEILKVICLLTIKCVNRQYQSRPTLFYLSVILSFCRYYLITIVEGGKDLQNY